VTAFNASLIFHLYGYPPAKEVYLFAGDNKKEKIEIDEFERKTATVLDSFHGVVIHAIGYTINFCKLCLNLLYIYLLLIQLFSSWSCGS
jgi:hypothetical protein